MDGHARRIDLDLQADSAIGSQTRGSLMAGLVQCPGEVAGSCITDLDFVFLRAHVQLSPEIATLFEKWAVSDASVPWFS